MFKNFLNNNGRPTYVNVDHVYCLNKIFKVSLEYIIKGVGGIMEDDKPIIVKDKKEDDLYIRLKNNEDMIDILSKQIEILKRNKRNND